MPCQNAEWEKGVVVIACVVASESRVAFLLWSHFPSVHQPLLSEALAGANRSVQHMNVQNPEAGRPICWVPEFRAG